MHTFIIDCVSPGIYSVRGNRVTVTAYTDYVEIIDNSGAETRTVSTEDRGTADAALGMAVKCALFYDREAA